MVKMWQRVSAPTRVGPNDRARSFPLRHGRIPNPPRPFRDGLHRILPVPTVPPSQTPPPVKEEALSSDHWPDRPYRDEPENGRVRRELRT